MTKIDKSDLTFLYIYDNILLVEHVALIRYAKRAAEC